MEKSARENCRKEVVGGKCSLVKTDSFGQTARSSGSNLAIVPSFDRVSRAVRVKTHTHTSIHAHIHKLHVQSGTEKDTYRGKKNSFWNGAVHGDATRRTLVSWFVVAPWILAGCQPVAKGPEEIQQPARGVGCGGGAIARKKNDTRVSIIVIPVRSGRVYVYPAAYTLLHTCAQLDPLVFARPVACEQNFSETIPGQVENPFLAVAAERKRGWAEGGTWERYRMKADQWKETRLQGAGRAEKGRGWKRGTKRTCRKAESESCGKREGEMHRVHGTIPGDEGATLLLHCSK